MTIPIRLSALFAIIAALALSACATQIDRKQDAAQSARDESGDIRVTNDQIDATLASLDNLMSVDATQLHPAFDRYSADLERMRAQAKLIGDGAADMRKHSQAYLTNWEKQHNDIQNSELRGTSETRYQTVTDRFQAVQGGSYDKSRTSLTQFIRNLDDVRIALRNDLTAHGVAAVAQSSVVQNARASGNNVKRELQEVRSGSIALAEMMSPTPPSTSGTSSTNQ